MKDVINTLQSAVDAAVPAVHHALGMSTDIALDNYKRLQPADFDGVAKQYGMDATIDYINEMERKLAEEM